MKKCNCCKIEKEFYEFNKQKTSNDGLSPKCRDCKKESDKKYYELNKQKILSYQKEYYKSNKEIVISKQKKYQYENKYKKKEYDKKYKEINRDKINIRKKERLKNDPIFKLSHDIGCIIRQSLKQKGYTKKSSSFEILGCSWDYFKSYLESKFEDWMNWDNRGLFNGELKYGWDIDHIIPLASAKTEEDVIKLNHYTNLQPLCSYVNRHIKKDNQ